MYVTYKRGDRVVLESFKGQILRIVVEDHGQFVVICHRETFGVEESRPRFAVGFKKRDIVPFNPNEIGCDPGVR